MSNDVEYAIAIAPWVVFIAAIAVFALYAQITEWRARQPRKSTTAHRVPGSKPYPPAA